MFSLMLPGLRQRNGTSRPQPMTAFRHVLLVAFAVTFIGYPIALYGMRWVFGSLAASTVASVMEDPSIIATIKAQNLALASEDDIALEKRDREWINERKDPAAPLISAMLSTPVSIQLRRLVETSHGALTHAIVMDGKGRNVAIASPTTDYFQGDEHKFMQTVAKASRAPDRGDIEPRHDGKGRACWVSYALFDGTVPIGAVAFEYNIERVSPDLCANRKTP
jgi:hypothetical protein